MTKICFTPLLTFEMHPGVQGVSKIWMTKLKSIMELEHYDSAKIEETVNWLHLYSSLWSVCILIFV